MQTAESLSDQEETRTEGINLAAAALVEQGLVKEGMSAFQAAAQTNQDNNRVLSNLLFASLYADHLTAQDVAQLHAKIGQLIAHNALNTTRTVTRASFRKIARTEKVSESLAKVGPMRVGFLSADFRSHPVGYFLRSLLCHRDPSRLQTFCYNLSTQGDELTSIIQASADNWLDCGQLSDDEAASCIKSDNLDILVDLAGHTATNRTGVLALRPAPIQAVYLGYPNSTGLPFIDGIISDTYVSPPDLDHLYSERVMRLHDCFLCFHPHDKAPAPATAPCLRNDFITFGSFNYLAKISQTCIRLWARVLDAIPNSRLVLKAVALNDANTRSLTLERFKMAGINPDRVEVLPPTLPLERFLAEYGKIDIALDPTPYGGGTTTCEALWMGVPVITLVGQSFAGRMTFSILNTCNLTEFVAHQPEDYVRIAQELSANPEHLQNLRQNLRKTVANSALCSGPMFAEAWTQAIESFVGAK